jgi:glutamyl-Q tRNA(Asp) synthetase
MEDLDPPREPKGAAQSILKSLQAHGLSWDGDVLWQSQRHAAYAEVIASMLAANQAFHCDCSRARVAAQGNIYTGHCRAQPPPENAICAIRVKVSANSPITIPDLLQAPIAQDVGHEVGDFVIQRKDGLYAYQLAVVLDDNYQTVNRVVRGSDLYDSTPRQVYLQQLLKLPTPLYMHIPVITNAAGQKLSKQTHAPALEDGDALQNLLLALRFLGQAMPADTASIDSLLHNAIDSWNPQAIPALAGIPESTLY